MATDHSNLLKKVLIELSRLPKTRAWRVEIGSARSLDGNRFIRFGLPGHSDIYCISDSSSHFIEIKIGKDKQREDQVNFQKMVEMCGGSYHIIKDEDDIERLSRLINNSIKK